MATRSAERTEAREVATLFEAECLGMRVGRLQRLVARQFATALRPHGLTVPQLEVLAMLTLHDEPIRPAVLADSMALERSTMSRNLAVMAESGWIAAAETSPTGRFMSVVITPAGTRTLARARRAWQEAQGAVVAALGADAPAMLDGWLDGLLIAVR